MFLAVLFRVVKTEKQTKCPLTLEWIKKMWYTHTHTHTHTRVCVCIMEYYSVTEITKFAICSTWVDLGAFLVT